MKNVKACLSILLLLALVLSDAPVCGEAPLTIAVYCPYDETFPFQADWPTLKAVEALCGAELEFIPIPTELYQSRVLSVLNASNGRPDIILGGQTHGEMAPLVQGGAVLAISEYAEFTPPFPGTGTGFGPFGGGRAAEA